MAAADIFQAGGLEQAIFAHLRAGGKAPGFAAAREFLNRNFAGESTRSRDVVYQAFRDSVEEGRRQNYRNPALPFRPDSGGQGFAGGYRPGFGGQREDRAQLVYTFGTPGTPNAWEFRYTATLLPGESQQAMEARIANDVLDFASRRSRSPDADEDMFDPSTRQATLTVVAVYSVRTP